MLCSVDALPFPRQFLMCLVAGLFVALIPPGSVGPRDDTVTLIRRQLSRLETACGFRDHVVFDPEGAAA
jgi:hypothetical protein